MSEPVYHFRLREKTFGPGTLSELFANPLLTQGDAMKVEARQQDGADWVPLASLIDFSQRWPEPPSGIPPIPGTTAPAAAPRPTPPFPRAPKAVPVDDVITWMSIALVIGITIVGYALVMDTSVGETFNLNKAHNRSVALAIGLALSGVSAIIVAIRSPKQS